MILELVLENYIPLQSSGIKKVSLSLGDVVNLLVSVNGAGKSSILKQMNALPAENGDFNNGRKYVRIMLNNKLFTLESVTGKDGYHSFKIDNGKELNPGGTISVQKKLVKQYFNLDSNMFKVLSGIKGGDVLSNMSAIRRKEFFMELYPNDVTYALQTFNKLKAERNSLKGAIKNQIKQYSEEKDKLERLENMEGSKELNVMIENLDQEIQEGLLISGSLAQYTSDPELQSKINQLGQLAKRLALTTISPNHFMNKDQLSNVIEHKKRQIEVSSRKVERFGTLVAECRSQLEQSGISEQDDPEKFKQHLEAVRDEIHREMRINTQLTFSFNELDFFSGKELSYDLVSVTEEFVSHLKRVVPAGREEISSSIYHMWLQDKEKLEVVIRNHESDLETTTHRIKHIENLDYTTCPDCKHNFKEGISPDEISKLVFKQKDLHRKIDDERESLRVLITDIEAEADWYYGMKHLTQFIHQNKSVKGLMDMVLEYQVGRYDANKGSIRLIEALVTHQELFENTKRLNLLTKEQVLLKKRLEVLENGTDKHLMDKLNHYENELEFWTQGVNMFKEEVKEKEGMLSSIIYYEQSVEGLSIRRAELEELIESEKNSLLKQELDSYLDLKGSEKRRYMQDIIRATSLKGVVDNIEDNIEKLKRRLLIVETLMNGLCPNKGLIGKLMTGFIETVCANMNAVIKEIWGSTLYIKPCSKENGDLNYKFPVVNGDDSETKDIEDCSDGECDIINFVFRFVMLRYHSHGIPLIMDEIGVKFDEVNRGRFFHYINEHVTSGRCEQLFMISHYVSQYDNFKNANLIALKYDGLTINGQVNKNTKVE